MWVITHIVIGPPIVVNLADLVNSCFHHVHHFIAHCPKPYPGGPRFACRAFLHHRHGG